MSQQPFAYGQHYGQPPPQPAPYQPAVNAAHPSYPVFPPNASLDRDYAASLGAFEYNSSRIPGLGGVAPTPPLPPQLQSAMANPYNAPTALGSWAQHPPFAPSYSAVEQPALFNATSLASSKAPIQPVSIPSIPPNPTAVAPPKAIPNSSNTNSSNTKPKPQADNDMEEGELDETQFEDLYESSQAEPAADAAEQATNTSAPEGIIPGEVEDDAEDEAFYDNDEDGKVSGDSRTGSDNARDRTGSYSPITPPRDVHGEVRSLQTSQEAQRGLAVPTGPKQTVNTSLNLVPGLGRLPPQKLNGAATAPAFQATHEGDSRDSSNAQQVRTPFKSLTEAKKEAQKAVLRLWPLGVRYQNYIDEGFDETFIKGLFGDLHLDMKAQSSKMATESALPSTRNTETSPAAKVAKPPQALDNQEHKPTSEVKESSTMDESAGKQEQRKDRIARLLAAKKAKEATAVSTPAEASKSKETAPKTTGKATNGYSEKSLLIQQKLKALEERRAKAQSNGSAQASAGPVQPSVPTSTASQAIPTSPAPAAKTGGTVPPSQGEALATNGRASSIPGMRNGSAAQLGPPTGPRKRPVAADFVEYSSSVGPLKRPFGQDRKESSLVIDVSEDSDGEMDMEIDSQPDMSTIRRDDTLRRGPSIREFPPLTDTTQRKFASPASSSTTPGVSGNGNKNPELEKTEKMIEEMKRKIAEREARKAQQKGAKQTPPRSQTPNGTSSMKLPKPSELRQLGKQEVVVRRDRIVSLDLPRVNSELDLKTLRLRQLQEEVARIQAEVDRHLEEKKRLGEELEVLDTTPVEDSSVEREEEPVAKPVSRAGSAASMDMQTTSSSNNTAPPSAPESTGSEPGEIAGTPVEQTDIEPEQPPVDVVAKQDTATSETVAPQNQIQDGPIPSATQPVAEQEQGQQAQHEITQSEVAKEHEPSREDNLQANGAASTFSAPNPYDSTSDTNNFAVGVTGEDAVMEDQVEGSAPLPENPSVNGDDATDSSSSDDENEDVAMDEDSDQSDSDDGYEPQVNEAGPELVPARVAAAESSSVAANQAKSPAEMPAPEQPTSKQPTPEHPNTNEAQDKISTAPQGQIASNPANLTETQSSGEVSTNAALANVDLTFKPYESPLQYFHAYRFHPLYHEKIPGGLKSLTYSNKIRAKDQVCPYELTGEPCPPNCTFQHFRSMTIPDDHILLELGRSDEFVGEQRTRFIQGLKQVLRHFRDKKIKDFDAISRGIIEFRSRFLGDESRVLPLEGVTI